jgi:hypothetical protein
MKQKVAIARAKQVLAPEIKGHCPTEIPIHLSASEDPTEVIGWLVGQAYVNYLTDDGLSEGKAKEIVADLASSSTVSLDVIVPKEATASESTDSGLKGPQSTDSEPTA